MCAPHIVNVYVVIVAWCCVVVWWKRHASVTFDFVRRLLYLGLRLAAEKLEPNRIL